MNNEKTSLAARLRALGANLSGNGKWLRAGISTYTKVSDYYDRVVEVGDEILLPFNGAAPDKRTYLGLEVVDGVAYVVMENNSSATISKGLSLREATWLYRTGDFQEISAFEVHEYKPKMTVLEQLQEWTKGSRYAMHGHTLFTRHSFSEVPVPKLKGVLSTRVRIYSRGKLRDAPIVGVEFSDGEPMFTVAGGRIYDVDTLFAAMLGGDAELVHRLTFAEGLLC